MDVNAINTNYGAPNFNAKAKVMRGNYTRKDFLDSALSGEAHEILDKLGSIYKDTIISIGAKVDESGIPVVYAINPVTEVVATAPTIIDKYHNKIGHNGAIYKLLKTLTDSGSLIYQMFWQVGEDGNHEVPPKNIKIDVAQHKTKLYERSIFVD